MSFSLFWIIALMGKTINIPWKSTTGWSPNFLFCKYDFIPPSEKPCKPIVISLFHCQWGKWHVHIIYFLWKHELHRARTMSFSPLAPYCLVPNKKFVSLTKYYRIYKWKSWCSTLSQSPNIMASCAHTDTDRQRCVTWVRIHLTLTAHLLLLRAAHHACTFTEKPWSKVSSFTTRSPPTVSITT